VLMRVCEDTRLSIYDGVRKASDLRSCILELPPSPGTVSRETLRRPHGTLQTTPVAAGCSWTPTKSAPNRTVKQRNLLMLEQRLRSPRAANLGRVLTRVATEEFWHFVNAGGGAPYNDALRQNGLPLPALQAATLSGSCSQPSHGRTRTVEYSHS
jgi:hypothetical protein